MAKKIEKTNAARLLDRAKISYALIPYEFDENDLAAQHVADSLGQAIERIRKHCGDGVLEHISSFQRDVMGE
jgi:Cys-tRNA(Pro)/Cys-tRNA(Cys) deacylase